MDTVTIDEITPESRAFDGIEGTTVTLGDGRQWLLATHAALGPLWDDLYDENVLRRQYTPGLVWLAACRLLRTNYELTFDEALVLFRGVSPAELIPAVEVVILGPEQRRGTYSEWVQATLWAAGINPDEIPASLRSRVIEVLEATERAIPESEFISSQQAMIARRQLFQSIAK